MQLCLHLLTLTISASKDCKIHKNLSWSTWKTKLKRFFFFHLFFFFNSQPKNTENSTIFSWPLGDTTRQRCEPPWFDLKPRYFHFNAPTSAHWLLLASQIKGGGMILPTSLAFALSLSPPMGVCVCLSRFKHILFEVQLRLQRSLPHPSGRHKWRWMSERMSFHWKFKSAQAKTEIQIVFSFHPSGYDWPQVWFQHLGWERLGIVLLDYVAQLEKKKKKRHFWSSAICLIALMRGITLEFTRLWDGFYESNMRCKNRRAN